MPIRTRRFAGSARAKASRARWHRLTRAGSVAALAATTVGVCAVEAGAAVRLDTSFGDRGVVRRVVPVESLFAADASADARGGLLTLAPGGATVTRLTSGGRVDRHFGRGGRASVDLPHRPDEYVDLFDLSFGYGLAVKRFGITASFGLVAADASVAAGQGVYRLTAGGTADPTFNHGLAKLVRLGRPAAGLAVDRRGRTVLAGYDARGYTLARLRLDGRLDRTYAKAGRWSLPVADVTAPRLTTTPQGVAIVDLPTMLGPRIRVTRALAGGHATTREIPVPLGDGAQLLAVAPATAGALIVVGIDDAGPWVVRVAAADALDPAFGDRGLVRLPAGSSVSDLKIISRGRIVLALRRAGGLSLLAFEPDGRPARSFGVHGSLSIRRDETDDHTGYRALPGPLVFDAARARLTLLAIGTHLAPTPSPDNPHEDPDDPPDDLILARFALHPAP